MQVVIFIIHKLHTRQWISNSQPYSPSFLIEKIWIRPYILFFNAFIFLSTAILMPNFHQKNLIQMHKFHLIRSPCNLPTQFPHSLLLIDTVGFEPITSLPNNSSLSSQNKCRQKSSPQLTFDLRYVNPNSISTFPFMIDTVKFEPIASLPNNYSL